MSSSTNRHKVHTLCNQQEVRKRSVPCTQRPRSPWQEQQVPSGGAAPRQARFLGFFLSVLHIPQLSEVLNRSCFCPAFFFGGLVQITYLPLPEAQSPGHRTAGDEFRGGTTPADSCRPPELWGSRFCGLNHPVQGALSQQPQQSPAEGNRDDTFC